MPFEDIDDRYEKGLRRLKSLRDTDEPTDTAALAAATLTLAQYLPAERREQPSTLCRLATSPGLSHWKLDKKTWVPFPYVKSPKRTARAFVSHVVQKGKVWEIDRLRPSHPELDPGARTLLRVIEGLHRASNARKVNRTPFLAEILGPGKSRWSDLEDVLGIVLAGFVAFSIHEDPEPDQAWVGSLREKFIRALDIDDVAIDEISLDRSWFAEVGVEGARRVGELDGRG